MRSRLRSNSRQRSLDSKGFNRTLAPPPATRPPEVCPHLLGNGECPHYCGMKIFIAALLVSLPLCAHAATPEPIVPGRDYHSYADTSAFVVKHLDLDLDTSFEL